ncbi:MAG: M36 family metallopeptidase, partial [Deltaproteobacteria bacterium]|nr:M36 family metallopeptidase [Deltaproteobacteria bacterium]
MHYRAPHAIRCALALGVLLCASHAFARRPDFLTQPSANEPGAVARTHLEASRAQLGLSRADITQALERRYTSARSGTTHLHLRQRVHGLEVVGGDLGVAVDREGRVFGRWNRFVRDSASRVNATTPQLSAAAALAAAALALDLPPPGPVAALDRPMGPRRGQRFPGGNVSRDEIPLQLVYAQSGAALRLAWDLVIRTPDGRHWWNAQVDATSGELLDRSDWIAREAYRVYPLPLDSPDDGGRSLETNVADATASEYGWHDTNGVAGA